MIWFSWGLTWVSTSAAVCTAIIVSGKCWPMLFMLLPACVSIHHKEKGND